MESFIEEVKEEERLDNSANCSEDEQKERDHFMRILNSFRYYRTFCMRRVDEAEKHYDELPDHQKKYISHYPDHLNAVRRGLEQNCQIIQLITKDVEHIFENKSAQEVCTDSKDSKPVQLPLVSDMDKVKTTLKQFVRDWSEAGHAERQACYLPVIQEIEKRFPADVCDPASIQILVPGAGLGRLAFELAKRGYSCQGNEWSLFMLFSSNFVLNKCTEVNSYTLYPWIHQWTNNVRTLDQMESISFPDTNPTDLPENANFSMAAGDFLEVYQEPETWDCLATVFFIDTAHNIIEYVETIYKILKPGGYWVNLGPLLYHYAGMPNEMSIELSYEDLKSVIQQVGFVFEKEEMNIKSTYTQNPKSMLQYAYDSVFFVARKPERSCDS